MTKRNHIEIKGAKMHNLKNIDVLIPHEKLTVITGLSGSGKSTLAFDTLYAEGQRRYIESLSAYARQFLGKLKKPEVDYIKGISPAIAIEQKVTSNNPRSTVGTRTEIYDYLKVLYARIGKTISPVSGQEVKKDTVTDVVQFLSQKEKKEKVMILSPLKSWEKYGVQRQLEILKQQGYVRIFVNDEVIRIEDALQNTPENVQSALLVVDRISIDFEQEDEVSRYGDSIQIAFDEGNGECFIFSLKDKRLHHFSNRFERDGIEFQEPTEHFFTFNNPFGACKTCEGYGYTIGIDPDLVIPDKTLTLYEGAVVPWRGEKSSKHLEKFIFSTLDFPIHKPIKDLTEKQLDILWNGLNGINDFFSFISAKSYKIQARVFLSRFRGKTLCPDCKGTRLRKDASYVKINGKSIVDIVLMPVDECLKFFENLEVEKHEKQIVHRIYPEIVGRLRFLQEVGLGYLTLNRASGTLSGGEAQRIHLATSLGSSLVGAMYILDEPSIGLHPRDTARFIKVLENLRDIGNTVIIVEHEEEVMKSADEIIDLGPKAGRFGGELVFQGKFNDLPKAKNSLTAKYLTGKEEIPVPEKRRKAKGKIKLNKAYKYNIKGVDVTFPLNNLVCVTGVSGSGKSTLVNEIFYPLLKRRLDNQSITESFFGELKGDINEIKNIEFIDQNPIGKSSRSNPATYVKAFDEIRTLFSRTPAAKARGLKPGYFSFNTDGGRCEVCEGEGIIRVEMQFMADVELICEECKGTRYKREALDILYHGKSIADVLEMSIDEAFEFFGEKRNRLEEKMIEKISPFIKVGLGYLKMGQASSTMSGGEAQRIKLASFLAKGSAIPSTLFLFDEPTTGLHFHDIKKLLTAFDELLENGHSIIVIEHNLEVIKYADYIIDIGPEGGDKGGQIVATGTPEEIVACSKSHTGYFLKEKLNG